MNMTYKISYPITEGCKIKGKPDLFSPSITSPVFPPLLPEKGTIGVVAPSRYAEKEWVEGLVGVLTRRGYKSVVHDQCFSREGVLAGSGIARAAAINEMFADKAIDAIFCARGGGGAMMLLDRLDYDLIKANPKPYVGFSDSTALLYALTGQTGMITFHGPMGGNFSETYYDKATEDELFMMIGQHHGPRELLFAQSNIVRTGVVEGRLVGGNISMLQSLIGTPYDWSAQDGILFIEEVGEPYYRIERMLTQMRLAGKFDRVRAVLVGDMVNLLDEKPDLDPKEHAYYGPSLREIILRQLPADVPIVFDVPCGHGKHLATFPVGAQVQVDLNGLQARMVVL